MSKPEKFDEYDFKGFLADTVGYSIRKVASKQSYSTSEEVIEERIQDEIDCLSAMQLVCYLGEYLNITVINHLDNEPSGELVEGGEA